jgi:hypothetical protein
MLLTPLVCGRRRRRRKRRRRERKGVKQQVTPAA